MTFPGHSWRASLPAITAALVLVALPMPLAAAPADVPHIDFVPANSNPPIPAGLKVACMKGPNSGAASNSCPIVHFHGNTTWVYSFLDNRVSLAFVTYDARNNVVANVTKDGARYVWNLISSEANRWVRAVGQSNQSVTISWAELGAIPQVVSVPANSNPPAPPGLVTDCVVSASSGAPSLTCPVVKYQDITTWAYSYADNRVAFAIVSYDANGNVIRNVQLNGARYVWQITTNPANMTATVFGQSNATVTVPWADLGP